MTEYKLEGAFLDRFNAALKIDDNAGLIRSVKDSAQSNGWPAGYWLSVRVPAVTTNPEVSNVRLRPVMMDMAWAVAVAGQPQCFLAALRFVFENPEWSSRSDIERDGREARFPADAAKYAEIRLQSLLAVGSANAAVPVLQSEFERFYSVCFRFSKGDVLAEAMFSRINKVASAVVVRARAGRDAEAEREDISRAVSSANSQAKSKASGRL